MGVFIDNKYLRWYFRIIINAKARNDSSLVHHHIFPKSYFTKYKSLKKHHWNGAYVTEREHFICHWLLVKCTAGKLNRSMRFAMHSMLNGSGCYENYIPCSRIYVLAQRSAKRTHSEETKAKISKNRKGKNKGQVTWNKGMKMPDWWRETMKEGWAKNNTWKDNFTKTPEQKEAQRQSAIKACVVEGIEYDSVKTAHREHPGLGEIKYITLVKRIESVNFPDYYYV